MFNQTESRYSKNGSAGLGSSRAEADPSSMMGNPKFTGSVDQMDQDNKSSAAGGKRLDLKALIKTSRLEETLFKLASVSLFLFCISSVPVFHLLYFIEDLQWLSFSYSTYLHKDMPAWLGIIFDPIRAVDTYPAFVIANILTLLLVFTIVTIVVVVILVMQRQSKVPIPALQVLRFLSALVMTALSIPITSFLAIGVHCVDGVMLKFNVQCYSSPHLLLYIFNILGLIVFVPLVVVGIVLFIENSPKSHSPVARAHGRVDVHDIVARIVLVFLDIVAYKSSELYQWIFMSISAVWLAFLSYEMSCTQPYYSTFTTAFRSGMTMATSTSMVATIVIRLLVGFDIAGYWFYMIPASIIGFIIGVLLTYGYSHYFLKNTVRKWHRILREEQATAKDESYANLKLSGYLPANKVATEEQLQNHVTSGVKVQDGTLPPAASKRSALKSSTSPVRAKSAGVSIFSDLVIPGKEPPLQTSDTNNAVPSSPLRFAVSANDDSDDETPDDIPTVPAVGKHRNIESVARPPRSVKAPPQITDEPDSEVSAAFSGLKRSPSTRFGITNAKAVLPPAEDSEMLVSGLAHGTSGDVFAIVTEKDPPQRQCVFNSPMDVEVCVRFIRKNPSVKKITIGLQLLERGLLEFPNDPLLLLLASTYLTLYYGDTGSKVADRLMKLLGTSKKPVPVDVKYLVFCREQAALDAGVGVIDRVATLALERDARRHHLRALRAMRDIWEAVRSQSTPSHLAETVSNLASYRWSASAAYQKLLARDQKNKNILRQYAMFLTSIEGDIVRAQQIIEHADEVETYDMYRRGINDAKRKGGAGESHNSRNEIILPPFADPSLFQGSEMDISTPVNENPAFDEIVKSATPRSAGARAPSVHGSQASGTSSNRADRQRTVLRLQLYQRLTQPLQGATSVSVLAFLFICALVAGFVVCLDLLQKTTSLLQVELLVTRRSRGDIQSLLEDIQEMLYYNMVGDPVGFAQIHSSLEFHLQRLLANGLSIINTLEKTTLTKPKEFRFFYSSITGDSKLDFHTLIMTPAQVSNVIAQTAALALSYKTFGELTLERFLQIPEFRMLKDSFFTSLESVKEVTTIVVDYYNMRANETNVELLVIMGLSLVLIAALSLMIDRQIVRKYFLHEGKVHAVLLSIKKRFAAQLVTDLEEEIENYSELVNGDGDNEAELDMGDNGLSGGSGEDEQSGKSSGIQKGANDSKKRQLWYYFSLYTYVVVVVAVIVALFTTTLTTLNVQGDLDRMVDSLNRRYFARSIRIIAREYIGPADVIPKHVVLQQLRSKIYSAVTVHAKLLADPEGLSVLMPDITSLPRNCSIVTSCMNFIEIPEIGYTRALSEMPLNVEFNRLMDVANRVCDSYLHDDPDKFKQWLLLRKLSEEVADRLLVIDDRYTELLETRAEETGKLIIVTFVLLIAGSLVACFAFISIGIIRLTRDAAVLITLLYTLPHSMVKELPEVMAFMDTGGLILMNSS